MLNVAYDPIYAHPLPEGHRFPMLKYELIPGQLLHEGTITEANIFSPQPCALDTVLLTHTQEYVDELLQLTLPARAQRKIGFPLSAQLVERELRIAQGTIDNCYFAKQYGVALNVAGGTHHAFADSGEGFCMLNDQCIAANYLLACGDAKKVLIVDLDVHQGNGSARIMQHTPAVFTFSMHGAHNYPFKKEKSDLDIGLPDGITGTEYLKILRETLPDLLDNEKPDFVFYLSGVDVLDTDKFGKLKLTMEECKQRDMFVFKELHERKIPVAVSMGGGYSADVRVITEAHCNTFRAAKQMWNL